MNNHDIYGAFVGGSKLTKTGDVPPWGMYLAGFVHFSLAALFIGGTAAHGSTLNPAQLKLPT